jgi:methionine-rich copper-binding protein CopC
MAFFRLVTVSLFLLFPHEVLAHASLVKSAPARRAVLFKAPPKIQLWFSEKLEARFSSLVVIDSTGRRVDLGDAAVDAKDSKQLSVGLSPIPPGQYRIKFRVLSVDGHVLEEDFPFIIRGGHTVK